MGGKGGGGGSSQQQVEAPTPQTTGGWTAVGSTTTAPKKVEEKKPPIIEGAANQTGQEAIAPQESQPYMPPGFGNYGAGTNLSPLGDTLVAGMQEVPGKPGPTVPQYQGQV